MQKDISWKSVVKASILYAIIGLFLYYISMLIPILIKASTPETTTEISLFYINSLNIFAIFLNLFIFLGIFSLIFSMLFFYSKKIRLKNLNSSILLKFSILLVPPAFFSLFLIGFKFNVDASTFLPYFDIHNIDNNMIDNFLFFFLLHLGNFIVGFFISNFLQYNNTSSK